MQRRRFKERKVKGIEKGEGREELIEKEEVTGAESGFLCQDV